MRPFTIGSCVLLVTVVSTAGCGPVGYVGFIGSNIDDILAPDVVVIANVDRFDGDVATLTVEEVLLSDITSDETEGNMIEVSPGSSVDVVISSEVKVAEGMSYAFFLNDALGSDEITARYVHDLADDRPVPPFGEPMESGRITSRTLVEVVDCLRSDDNGDLPNSDSRLDYIMELVESDPRRRGQVDIDHCL